MVVVVAVVSVVVAVAVVTIMTTVTTMTTGFWCRPMWGGTLRNDNRDFKIGDYGRLGRLDRCHVTQNTRDLLPSSFWDGMFSPGFSS